MTSTQLLEYAQRLQAIAQAGIAYHRNQYDFERYQELRALSAKILEELTDEPFEKIVRVFASETGYQTPKVDVRAVMFRGGNEILLVQEKSDHNHWTLPGGWADVGCTPFEAAVKEAEEETGLRVKPVRLLAVLDKRKHPHPPQPWYVYKIFIQCLIEGGEWKQVTPETCGARWFPKDELAATSLSTDRVTLSQLEKLFRFAEDPTLLPLCD
jgi:ADP-ribose pyrophosphatase YjhB (NUDIX family)